MTPRGFYARARRGEIPQFSGISSRYAEPDASEFVAETSRADADAQATAPVLPLAAPLPAFA